MKRFDLYIIIYIGLLLTGCHEYPTPPEEQPRAEAERTVIVYMAADNSLTLQVREDTTEMVRSKAAIPEDVNFIIYLDDRLHKPAIYELSAKKGLRLWKQYQEELCSTNADVMLNALQQIEHFFPARHYGITLWSHATGWTPRRDTFGKDETHGTMQGEGEMEIPELHNVLAHFPKFDYLFFDACFMQCIEVAYELRDVTRWMISSPAEIPAPGAPYHRIVESLCKGDAEGIVEGYDSAYPLNSTYPGVLLSCIDCNELDDLARVTGQFLTPFYMERSQPSAEGFQVYCNFLDKYTNYFDMRTTMCRLLSQEDYSVWMEYFDKAVPLRTHSYTNKWFSNGLCAYPFLEDPECYGGVSMFVPLSVYDDYGWNAEFQKTSWYEAAGWARTGW